MARDVTLAGVTVQNVPDEMTEGGLADLMVQRGQLTPEQAATALNQEIIGPETSGPTEDFFIGAGQSFAERSFGLIDSEIQAPDTLAAGLGRAAPLVAGSFLAPGTIVGQAGAAGVLEALRSGTSGSDVLQQMLLGGGGAAVGSVLGRVATGIGKGTDAIRKTAGQKFNSDILRRMESGLQSIGGLSRLARFNQKAINQAAAKTIGQTADELTPEVLAAGSRTIGSIYKNLLGKNVAVDVGDLKPALAKLDIGTKAKKLIPDDATTLAGPTVTNLRRALNERISSLRGQNDAMADDLIEVVNDLDELIGQAIGEDALPLLRVAREGWKNLKILESLPSVRNTGNVAAGQLSGKLASTRGYGSTFIENRGGVLPDTQQLFNLTREINKTRAIVGDSGTATRLLAGSGLGGILGAAATGDIEGAAKGALLGAGAIGGGKLLGELTTVAGSSRGVPIEALTKLLGGTSQAAGAER